MQNARVLGFLSMCMGPSFSWLGRQIVNLEVAGSNPVGPAIHFSALGFPKLQFHVYLFLSFFPTHA